MQNDVKRMDSFLEGSIRSENGISLLQIMIALAVLMTIVMMARPSYKSVPQNQSAHSEEVGSVAMDLFRLECEEDGFGDRFQSCVDRDLELCRRLLKRAVAKCGHWLDPLDAAYLVQEDPSIDFKKVTYRVNKCVRFVFVAHLENRITQDGRCRSYLDQLEGRPLSKPNWTRKEG